MLAAATFLGVVASCRIDFEDRLPHRFSLLVVNETNELVRLRIADTTGILDLNGKEKWVSEVTVPDWVEPPANSYLRYLLLGGVDFFEAGAETPHRSYSYYNFHCIDATGESEDDAECVFIRTDGAVDRLFVESPDRPFYLEHDRANSGLVRMVISYVPRGQFLEVINESRDRIRIQIAMRDDASFLASGYRHSSGFLALDNDERTTLAMSPGAGPRESAVNIRYIRLFAALHFYRLGAHTPYRSYVYDTWWCGPDVTDDTSCVYYRRSDGAVDRLFERSPDRPFYLERDREDLNLARLVVTFEPSGVPGSESPAPARDAMP